MIINRGPIVDIDNQKYIFDYSACNYPVGVVEDQIYYFNEDNIDKVVFEGYSDQDEMRFQELFKEMKNNLDDDIQHLRIYTLGRCIIYIYYFEYGFNF